jgi:hypothetical protein
MRESRHFGVRLAVYQHGLATRPTLGSPEEYIGIESTKFFDRFDGLHWRGT